MADLRFSEQAERDLVEIGNFIARDNPAKLQIDDRLALAERIDIEKGATGKAGAPGQQFPPIDEHDLKSPV